MSGLIVPIHVDALMVETPRRVLGPDLDFARLPWNDGTRDHNSDTPNLAVAANAQPFHERFLSLSPGVHLHWSLPDGLTRGATAQLPWADEPIDRLFFPPAPNRWLVLRRQAMRPRDQDDLGCWIVESDFLHPFDDKTGRQDDTDALPITFPVASHGSHEPPFVRLGRKIDLIRNDYWEDGPERYLPHRGKSLTALGYDDPHFAALYANCRSVFGLHDTRLPVTPAVYDVFGWYSDHVTEPLGAFVDSLANKTDLDLIGRLNARPHEQPLRADAKLTAALRRTAHALLLADAFGWTLGDGTGPIPSRILCHGRVELDPSQPGHSLPEHRITAPIALGHTGTEAMGALIAELLGTGRKGSRKHEIEERLEALRLAPMFRDHPLDIGPKFREARHSDQFRVEANRRYWSIRSTNSDDKSVTARQPEMPIALAHAVHRLNGAQHAYDTASGEIALLRQRLYSDWHRWMLARYRRDDHADFRIDVNAFAVLITRDCAELREKIAARGELTITLDDGQWTVDAGASVDGSLAAVTARAFKQAARLVAKAARDARGVPRFHLGRLPGARYWRSRDPVAVLSHPLARPSRRHGQDGRDHAEGLLKCVPFPLVPDPSMVSKDLAFDLVRGVERFSKRGRLEMVRSTQGRGSWDPFLFEWSVQVESLTEGGNELQHDRGYDPGFISKNFTLPETECDLAEIPDRAYSGRVVQLHGRATLSPHADAMLKQRIESYLGTVAGPDDRLAVAAFATAGPVGGLADAIERFWEREAGEKGKDRLEAENDAAQGRISKAPLAVLLDAYRLVETEDLRTLSQALGGFNDALAGFQNELQLPIADPLGFPEEQALTARVAEALGDFHGASPRPNHPFHPIRSGRFMVEQLRLVDTFGQIVNWTPSRVIAAETFANETADRLTLAPRLTQSAQLAAHWLSARDGDLEMNDHPATSPVCGWLVTNHVDWGEISVHAPEGRLLGAVDGTGHWRQAPGPGSAPSGPHEIANPYLASAVGWLAGRTDGPDFMQAFAATLDTALNAINPADMEDHPARALLSGRPLAVVRCRMGLELAGAPLTSGSWADLIARLNGAPPSTHAFTGVRFPIRIGEHSQLGDGVVGYWIEDAPTDETEGGFRGGKLWCPQPNEASGRPGHDDIVMIEDHADHPHALNRAIADAPLTLTLLIDPRASVHFTSGILPTKILRVPPEQYRPAMGAIGISLLTAPVLTPSQRLELQLPADPDGAWYWLEKTPAGWDELAAERRVTREALIAAFPQTGADLWPKLIAAGWVAAGDAEAPARLVAPSPDQPAQLDGETHESSLKILRTLNAIATGIRRPSREARFSGTVEAREGWIQLRPHIQEPGD